MKESLRDIFEMENLIASKSLDFAVRIVNLNKYLTRKQKEYVLSKQILRSGTSIGANVSEGERAQSRADFLTKMTIALKEANETKYWLTLLFRTNYINKAQYESILNDLAELLRILTAICKAVSSDIS